MLDTAKLRFIKNLTSASIFSKKNMTAPGQWCEGTAVVRSLKMSLPSYTWMVRGSPGARVTIAWRVGDVDLAINAAFNVQMFR